MEKHISVLCLLTFLLQQAGCEDLVNIALHKTPTQNGTLEDPRGIFWNVSHSVDGLTHCTYVDGQHYSATADENDPWWQLDLGSIYTIKAMHLLGRSDTHKQLGGFRLWAGLDKDNLSMVYEDNWRDYNNGNIWVNITIIARVIKIDLPRDKTADRIIAGPLVLCEVEVLISSTGPNIKHTSTTSGSGIYEGFGSHLAIDGKYPSAIEMTPEACNCCSITWGTGTLWWTIDFGQPRRIKRVDITGRMDQGNQNQSKDLSIFISSASPEPPSGLFGDLIWNITSSESGNYFRHTFPSPRVFRYMSITQQGSSTHFMTICEVDFYAVECQPGRYGFNCSDTCGQCIPNNTTCLVNNGTCPTGCSPGFDYTRDQTCKTECQPGRYGFNCSDTCGQCIPNNTICSVSNGTCPTGCSPGFDYTRDQKCKAECQPGHYGPSCSQTCGHCVGDTTLCNKIDGSCRAGCAVGYNYTAGNKCNIECSNGHYGLNCSETCGHCNKDRNTCNKIDGSCPAGCAAGYNHTADIKCNTECKPGHYGQNCAQTCGYCVEDPTLCNRTDGSCPGGCAAGYNYTAGNKCNIECQSGHYGLNCSQTCGHCFKGIQSCRQQDGSCLAGCAAGYNHTEDNTCKTLCKPGHYGNNCSNTCGNCIDGKSNCTVTLGECPNGCLPGYNHTADKACKTTCNDGNFGQNCFEKCGQCSGGSIQCSKTDGVCRLQCADGFKGAKCQEENSPLDKCRPGQYGQNCDGTCGHCIDGTCSITDGSCLAGCASGYDYVIDMSCKRECQRGFYGLNCSETCGHCIHGATTCSVIDGTCPSGCKPGYNPADRTCKTGVNILRAPGFSRNTSQSSQYLDSDSSRAIDGFKGPDSETCKCCSQTQNAEVSWWQVDIGMVLPIGEIVLYGQNGNRLSLSGFSVYLSTSVSFPDVPFVKANDDVVNVTYHIDALGNNARYVRIQRNGVLIICEVEIFLSDKTCPPNTYTVYCIPCGHCYAGLPCDDITGRCPNGCETGYSGDTCNQAINTGTSYGTKDVIGAAIGGTIGGAIFILLIGMLVQRRNKLRCPWVCQTSQDYESPKPRENADDQNMYDVLDIPDLSDQSVSGSVKCMEEVNAATPHYQNTNI